MKTTWNFIVGKKAADIALVVVCATLVGAGLYAKSLADVASRLSDNLEESMKAPSITYLWLIGDKGPRHRSAPSQSTTVSLLTPAN